MSAHNSEIDARLLDLLATHPLAQALKKQDPSASLARTVLNIPPEDCADNLTVGTLGAGTVGCAASPAVLVSNDARKVLAGFHIGRGLTGHVGFAHGGALAMLLDECCGRASLTLFETTLVDDREKGGRAASPGPPKKSAAVTAQLSIMYTAPIPIDSLVLIEATLDTEASSGRKAWSVAKAWVVPSKEGDKDLLVAEARGLFIEPKRPS